MSETALTLSPDLAYLIFETVKFFAFCFVLWTIQTWF